MTKRETVKSALYHKAPPSVPLHFTFSQGAREKLAEHFGSDAPENIIDNHLLAGEPSPPAPGYKNDLYDKR
jgi:hypothetical protein